MKETQTYPTVSVIIRGYNREWYIGWAVRTFALGMKENFFLRRSDIDG